jgi:hypothetical protein
MKLVVMGRESLDTLACCQIEVLAHGSLQKEEALEIAKLAEQSIQSRKLPQDQLFIRRNTFLSPGSNVVYKHQLRDLTGFNNCIE